MMGKLTLITILLTCIKSAPIFGVNDMASPHVNQQASAQRSTGLFPFNRRGLVFSDVNSPRINQQQNIDTQENGWIGGEDEWGGNDVFGFNSFNNVGGVEKDDDFSGGMPFPSSGFTLANAINGVLSRRHLDLSYMASPTVIMEQQMQTTSNDVPVLVAEDGSLSQPDWTNWENGWGHLQSNGMGMGSFIN
jgi:hypothetical protein